MQNDPMQNDLERPDEYQELGDEIYCWMPSNYDRECNGSCVAFDHIFEEDQSRSPCSVINMVKSLTLSQAKISNYTQSRARLDAVPNQVPPKVR